MIYCVSKIISFDGYFPRMVDIKIVAEKLTFSLYKL